MANTLASGAIHTLAAFTVVDERPFAADALESVARLDATQELALGVAVAAGAGAAIRIGCARAR